MSSEQDFEIVYPHQEREGKILEELLSLDGLQDEELNIITAEKMDEDNIDYDQAQTWQTSPQMRRDEKPNLC